MKVRKTMADILSVLKQDENIAYWKTIPGQAARSVAFPETMDHRLVNALTRRGIPSLYTHQAQAFHIAEQQKDLVAVTPTASGKTLCYNLPVLQTVLKDSSKRALYLFPTKALAQDQKSEMNDIIDEMGVSLNSYTYDGDTPGNIRQKIRQAGHIVITNPDMLHSAILPHHTKWVSLFENLKYIVIDELHTYRGVFGSHVANVIRRLKRICQYYGSNPTFICTSATIANPKEHAERLTGRKMTLIDDNGAPSVKKHFIFYNPPVVNQQMNIRRSASLEVRTLAKEFLENEIQTIVFARSRTRVEILLSYLQTLNKGRKDRATIRAYRGGYLPSERREIEKGLRSGDIQGVVSTNALELGVDIGQLQVCIMTGYPGSVSSTWQQAGRAGRREDEAVILLVATSSPLDQYIIQHPDYFFDRNPEEARINPDNLIILVDHIKCAAYELPFKEEATFDGIEVEEICRFLSDEDVLHLQAGKWFWMNDGFPATNISLRSATQDNVVIIDQTQVANVKVLGEMDRFSAMTLLHEEAIYMHQGEQYQVETLDWEEKKAFVRQVDVNYYTDANLAVQLDVLEADKSAVDSEMMERAYGDVSVRAKATLFKKIRFETHDNVGWGPIHLPEEEMHTSAAWMSFSESFVNQLGATKFEEALLGISQILRHAAPLFVMCDPVDLAVVPMIKAPHNEKPTIFLYDKYPGGIGLSEKLYERMPFLLKEVLKMVERCQCESGCPSCIGTDSGDKKGIQKLLRALIGENTYVS
ncbi:DEAD/DEAH box helicase domain-containing protein [Pullulanibacillus pueri]|uniref:Putative ATP-dependent helicase YprA n=1 Tax=Pullulanibacillus pueri TaxID=1437324 RepID=A0A8J2ZYB0_9BACL|nr:DEAD/DEAH box helicase [Pullulanibacillus pueri]MBM7681000.1 DEAD/DEAH box helicase domain-containing protein [Pullulanibacillus pueri]GGH86260.1 putative ATP-dependent helicase YprA [Pullulanibacillus pueri]